MEESIYKYLKVGLVQSQAYPDSFVSDENCIENFGKTSGDTFFNAVEFHSPKDRAIRKECMKILKDSGMYRVYMGTVEFANTSSNMISFDKSARKAALGISCRLIDDALEWEAEEILFFSAPDVGEEHRKEAYKYLEEYYINLADYIARQDRIKLTMEINDRNPIAKNFLCGPIEEAIAVCENVKKHYPDFGLTIDLCHLPLLEEEPRATVLKAKDMFVHAHIGTCVKNPKSELRGDTHPGFQVEYSENNVNDVVEFIKAGIESEAISTEHAMPLSIEVRPYGDQTADDVVEYAKDILRNAWKEV